MKNPYKKTEVLAEAKHPFYDLKNTLYSVLRKQDIALDIYFTERELHAWDEITIDIKCCLTSHFMYAACTAGEADIHVFGDALYLFSRNLAQKLGIDNKEERRLLAITGPVVNVSKNTGRSILIELWRDGLLNLFCSRYRQAVHFRIGGWNENKSSKGSCGVVEDVYIGEPHPPLVSPIFRQKFGKKGNAKTHPELVREVKKRLENLLVSQDVFQIQKEGDLENFLFLTSKEIEAVSNYLVKYYGKSIFSESKQKDLTRDFLKTILDNLNIQVGHYPECKTWSV